MTEANPSSFFFNCWRKKVKKVKFTWKKTTEGAITNSRNSPCRSTQQLRHLVVCKMQWGAIRCKQIIRWRHLTRMKNVMLCNAENIWERSIQGRLSSGNRSAICSWRSLNNWSLRSCNLKKYQKFQISRLFSRWEEFMGLSDARKRFIKNPSEQSWKNYFWREHQLQLFFPKLMSF